ncbi:hypothetical protein BDR07DRAFT_1610532 [Suillus spraguei]|nr:hypothetical protein BDR07DRAFT_1610532 [Suillus spraguei]
MSTEGGCSRFNKPSYCSSTTSADSSSNSSLTPSSTDSFSSSTSTSTLPATTPETSTSSTTYVSDTSSTTYVSDTSSTSTSGPSFTISASTTSSTVVIPPSTSSSAAAASTSSGGGANLATSSASTINVGAIAGGVVGGAVVLVLLILGFVLCRRARLKKVAPSSQFAETIKRGELPVLRLDCGVEIVPSPDHHHVPLSLRQDTYYASPAMSDMKLPDGMGGSDDQSVYSSEKPLQPLRRPGYQGSNESVTMGNTARRVSSIGSSQEFWSRDAGKFDIRKDHRSISPSLLTPATRL